MDPQEQYSAPALEWAALQVLAAETNPAQTIAEGGWLADYFAGEGTAAAFAQLSQAKAPAVLAPPDQLAEEARAKLADLGDDALDMLRGDLALWAQVRLIVTTLSNSGRQALGSIQAAQANGSAPDLGTLIQALLAVLDDAAALARNDGGIRATLGTLAGRYWDALAERHHAMPTGFGSLDNMLGDGFQPRRLAVLLGGPGKGKTSLASQIAEHVADNKRPVVYLTTEDTPHILLCKAIARHGNIDFKAVQRGHQNARDAIAATLDTLRQRESARRLLYLDTYGGIAKLRAVARSHFARFADGGSGLLVVDYLQRIARMDMGDRQELRQAVGALTDRLRELARELDCSVLALASQNRAAYNGAKGNGAGLASAKESGDVEYSADIVMVLDDDESPRYTVLPQHDARLLRIPKNRQGETGDVPLDWYGSRQKFTAVARGE